MGINKLIYQFPLVLASIDVGSNAIRMVIAEFVDSANYRVLYSHRASIRLGHSVFVSGKLDPELKEKTILLLKSFREKMTEFSVKAYRCVATSAIRESQEGESFASRIQQESGITLEIISGTEEARLVYIAIRSKISLGDQSWLLIDLGGGSVELSLIKSTGVLWSESHTMGSVKLLEELTPTENGAGKLRNLITEYVSLLKIPYPGSLANLGGLIATGGNIEDLAKIAFIQPGDDGVCALPLSKLSQTIETLFRLSYKERIEQLHLREDRADVILPASLVYEHIAKLAKVDSILIPGVGTKEGALYDLAQQLTKPFSHFEDNEKFIEESCLTIGARFMFDEPHARQVMNLAVSLFDQLQYIHQLTDEDKKFLIAAALLHDIGTYISYHKHHKHSQYLIENSEIAGFNESEHLLVACIARYHRKSDPSVEHASFAALSKEDQKKVQILSSLLRLADSLDREHQSKVDRLFIKKKESSILIVLRGKGDLSLECWSFKKKSKLFSELFDISVEITEQFDL